MRKPNRWLGCAVVALAAAACGDDPVGPPRSWTGTISGLVVDSLGYRVPNATVTVQLITMLSPGAETRGSCSGHLVRTQTVVANADAEYTTPIGGGVLPFLSCVFVDARVTQLGKTLSGSTEVDSVMLGPHAVIDLQVLVKVRPVP